MKTVIQIILLYSSVLKVRAVFEPKFSQDLQLDAPNGALSVPKGTSLYAIALTNKTISVRANEPKKISCTVPIDAFEDSITGIARATLFNNDQRILVWGVRAEDADNTYYSLLAIDPNVCAYKSARQLPDDDKLEEARFSSLPRVYGGEYSFLVFFPSQRHCWPCRFNGLAEIQEEPRILESEAGESLTTSFHLQPFDQTDAGRGGWFYAYNFPNNTAVIKLIDEAFNVTRRAYVDFTVQALAANHKVIRNSGTCSTTANRVVCRRFDSKLRIMQSIDISLNNTVAAVSLEFDSRGNWFVAAAELGNVYVFIYNVDGRLLGELDFGRIESGYKVRELNGYITLQQRDYHYCLYVLQDKARHMIKCIPTNDYVHS